MTARRLERLRETLRRRQPDLTLLMENVHKPHNFAAILRTCDAVGVLECHAVGPTSKVRRHHATAGGSQRWVLLRPHETLAEGAAAVREQSMQVVAAHAGPEAVGFREVDFTRPTAILLGSELYGVSPAAQRQADELITIPMMGMVASLNVSVAAALILYEAQRQREEAGLYERCRLDTATFDRLLFEWAQPRIADYCKREGLPYPELDDNGDVLRES